MTDWSIHSNIIKPGQTKDIRLPVGKLPSETKVFMHASFYRSAQKGPTILIMGGVHGDEVCGIEIVRKIMVENDLENIKKGSIVAIPLLNAFGFNNFSRDMPDGKDVNRSFPGKKRGSLASRVARTLTDKILPYVDVILDFHSGGGSRYNYPQVRYTARFRKNKELAEIFAAPFSIAKPEIKGSLRREATKRSIATLVYEGGESSRIDGFAVERAISGVKRILVHYEMIEKSPLIPAKTEHLNFTSWIRAGEGGIFKCYKNSGQKVKKGEPIGVIQDPYGLKKIYVLSNSEGHIIGHSNAPIVNVGDALFHIARNR